MQSTIFSGSWYDGDKKPGGFENSASASYRLNVATFQGSVLCASFAILEKYNLTGRNELYDSIKSHEVVLTKIYYDCTLSPELTEQCLRKGYLIYKMKFEFFNFVFFTDIPKPMSAFTAYFTPFEGITWILIVSCCTVITGFLTIGAYEKKGLQKTIGFNLFLVTCLLLNQTEGGIHRIIGRNRVKIPVLLAWLFGCFILMSNIYGGEIYSSLTVPGLPKLPETLLGAIASGMTVWTCADYTETGSASISRSVLLDQIIPEVVSSNYSSPLI